MAVTTEGHEYMPLDGRLGSAAMAEAGVTPEGVRAGDRAALQAVVERRGPAVIAFCTQVCGPQQAAHAGAEAFARFRAAVRDAPDLGAVDPEALLRGATRHAAASMARVPMGPPPHGRLRSRGTQTCQHVPTMLAARANGAVGNADLERLARHLDRCERCAALSEIFHRAELNYLDPPFDTLGTDTSSVLLDALYAVPMEAIGVAPAPSGQGSAEPVALHGAFPQLPDLEDEIPLEPEPEPVAAAVVVEDDEAVDDAPELEDVELEDGDVFEDDEEDELDEVDAAEEWETVSEEVVDHEMPDAAAGAVVLEGGHQRRPSRPARVLRIGVPAALVAVVAAAALAISGVLGGDEGTPPQARRQAPVGIQAPVITPLPVGTHDGDAAASDTPAAGATTTP